MGFLDFSKDICNRKQAFVKLMTNKVLFVSVVQVRFD